MPSLGLECVLCVGGGGLKKQLSTTYSVKFYAVHHFVHRSDKHMHVLCALSAITCTNCIQCLTKKLALRIWHHNVLCRCFTRWAKL